MRPTMAPRGEPPLERRVRWERTGETSFPLRAEVDGELWRVRLGDYPAEPAYTLVIGDDDVASFDDWPDVWHDPGRTEAPPTKPAGAASLDVKQRIRHAHWLGNERTGDGRLSVLGRDLAGQRASGSTIAGARFDRCVLDRMDLGFADAQEIEVVDSSAVLVILARADLTRARFERVRMTEADLRLADLEGARFGGCDLGGALLDRAILDGVVAEATSFRGAQLGDARLDGARFVGCDFRDADLSRVDPVLTRLGTATGAVFERCDFRGAKLAGRRLANTVFDGCHWFGATGRPAMEGPVRVSAPDFSLAGDGSDVRDEAAWLALFGD